MKTKHPARLEVISRLPPASVAAHTTPVLFVHGAYAGAWCWEVNFLDYFAQAGWPAYALSLSGHAGSAGRERLDLLSVDDYVADVCELVAKWPVAPVLIGHSMGGFVVQKFLEVHKATAAVLMASVPPKGLVSAWSSMVMRDTGLLWDLNRLLAGQHPSTDALRRALFYQNVSDELLTVCFERMQPESLRAIWDMSGFNLPKLSSGALKTPILVMGAEEDHLIPTGCIYETASTYRVSPKLFAKMGHGMMLEAGWQEPAKSILEWLAQCHIS